MVSDPQTVIESQWDDSAKSIILTQLVSKWTWADLHEHTQEVVVPMLKSVSHPVAIIVEIKSQDGVFGPQFTQNVTQATEMYENLNIELIVYTTRLRDIGLLFKAANLKLGLQNCHYHYAATLERAREIIALFRQHS